ncbi:hypothetical protein D3C85_1306150 [compost metagenome]
MPGEAGAPLAPDRFRAEGTFVVPHLAFEERRPLPMPRMLVHPRGDRAQLVEGVVQVVRFRLHPGDEVEQHHHPRFGEGCGAHVLDQRAVQPGHGERRLHAGFRAQGLHPGQFGAHAVGAVVAQAVYSQHPFQRAMGHQEHGVLREAYQPQLGVCVDVPAGERSAGHAGEVVLVLGFVDGVHRSHLFSSCGGSGATAVTS